MNITNETLDLGCMEEMPLFCWILVPGSCFAVLLGAIPSKISFKGFKGWMLDLIFLFCFCLVALLLFKAAISFQFFFEVSRHVNGRRGTEIKK